MQKGGAGGGGAGDDSQIELTAEGGLDDDGVEEAMDEEDEGGLDDDFEGEMKMNNRRLTKR